MKTLPNNILHTLASHYHHDAYDFLERFDHMLEVQTHKMGRVKSFVDLMMGCECALKAHIFLTRQEENPVTEYRKIRKLGHDIEKLADTASFLEDRSFYNFIKTQTIPFSVIFRYSLDASETFFPSMLDREDAQINYSKTIGKQLWVMEIRNCLEAILESANSEFSGFVDEGNIFEHEQQMKEFADMCMR